MARIPVPTGATPLQQLVPVVDTQGKIKGVVLQNVSTVDVYVSEDANRLQNVSPAGLPTVGLHFPPDSSPPWQLVLPMFCGKLYARAQGAGAAMEVILYDVCSQPAAAAVPVAA